MACIHPHIHLNGSNRGNLIADRAKQWMAVDAALKVLCSTAPHSRDFYHIIGAWDLAWLEHERRVVMLEALLADIAAEHNTLVDGAHNGQ